MQDKEREREREKYTDFGILNQSHLSFISIRQGKHL